MRITGLGDSSWHACAFLSEEEDIIGPEGEIVCGLTALCGEQDQPSRTDRSSEPVETGMTGNGDMIDIVHGSPPHSSIIPFKPHRLDKVDSRPQTGAKAQDSADVSGNFRFKKGNTHSG